MPHRSPCFRARHAAFVLAAVTAAAAVGCSQPPAQVTVQAPSGGSPTGTAVSADGISVAGSGDVSGAPDTLTITFGVSLERPTVNAAVADNAALATKMVDTIKAGGVDEKDIRTNSYNVSPSFDYVQGKQVPKGFQVTNSVVVKVHDLPKAGTLIDAVSQAGGNDVQVQGVSFTLEDNKALLARARDAAYADAKAKAEQFASLSGRKLGPVVSITEATIPTEFKAVAQATSDTAAGAASTPVSPGQVTTNLQVQVRYSFA